ncbi:BBSome complex assembly protein BBS10 [Echeneis naucrates]|uniref:BBSome complex assembly protein BBS10 n=1 Tax=Echeneis naucrates TaxID=173247 RepID=UPI001114326E|nr:Bardet-Biedl syndrome 10 protein [Echeneis naucrates]
MLPVEHFCFKHVLQTVCALEAVVLRSFGPQGGQVLFTRDTGQAMLSCSGTHILTALHLEHPLARMVVECVRKHSTATGDGSKTFILLLASLLRMIHTIACKEPNVSHTYNSREAAEAATARHLADKLLVFALEEMNSLVAKGVVPYGYCVLWEDFTTETQSLPHTNNHGVQKLLSSFFHTRLGYTHCDLISNLTCRLLQQLKFNNDQPSLALQFVNDNFPALHTPVTGFPISCSRLIEGQVIHRDFATPCPQTDQAVKAVVFTGFLQPKLLSGVDVLEVGSRLQMMEETSRKATSFVEFSVWSERSLECFLESLQSLGVSVLFCALKQSPAALASAAQAEMCVVECISEDELSLFVKLSGTTPVSDCSTIEPANIATLTFCHRILLGVHRYVHVAFHDLEERIMYKPSSLVLCGPGEGQTDQYACAIQDAICMMLTTCKYMGMTATTVPKRAVPSQHKNTSSYTDGQSGKTVDTSSNSPPYQRGRILPGCVIPAGGIFEILLNHAILHHRHAVSESADIGIDAVPQLLANALLTVPQQIYSNNLRHFLQIQSRILRYLPNQSHTLHFPYKEEHSTSLIRGNGTREIPVEGGELSMHCCRKADMSPKVSMLDTGLESVSCKYELLLAVLQCLRSLLRVDMVLCTQTALHARSQRLANISWEGTEDEPDD